MERRRGCAGPGGGVDLGDRSSRGVGRHRGPVRRDRGPGRSGRGRASPIRQRARSLDRGGRSWRGRPRSWPSRGDGDPRDAVLAAEPTPVRVVAEADLPAVAAAIGDLADLKSTFTLGHSSGVAPSPWRPRGPRASTRHRRRVQARRAAPRPRPGRHLECHLGAPGPPHARPSGSRFGCTPTTPSGSSRGPRPLRPIAPLAGMHHERQDGSGYHRGSPGRDIPVEARLLAAADAFHAMTQARPYRAARVRRRGRRRASARGRAGRLDGDAVGAVVAAAGTRDARSARRGRQG